MARYEITNRQEPIDFECSGHVARTLQNAKNLLMLRMGEVPYDRLRGVDPALFDLPLTRLQEELLPELDRVMMWEPDVEVVSATAEADADGGTLITVVLDVSGDENSGGERI